MNRPDKAIDYLAGATADEALISLRCIGTPVLDYIAHLEQQVASAPREITGDLLTDDMLVWNDDYEVKGGNIGRWKELSTIRTASHFRYIVKPKPVEEDTATPEEREAADKLVSPVEPQGDGYIHIAVVLHNGAEVIAKRSPNGVWWWESLPVSGPDHKRYGTWNDLLDHYGRKLPLTIVPLYPSTHCTRCRELEVEVTDLRDRVKYAGETESALTEQLKRLEDVHEELKRETKQRSDRADVEHGGTLNELQQLQDKHREVVEKVHYRRQLAVAVYNDPEVTSVRHMKADDEIRFSDWVLDLLQPPQVKTVDEMNAVRSLVALKKCLIDTLRSNPDAVHAVRKLLEEKA